MTESEEPKKTQHIKCPGCKKLGIRMITGPVTDDGFEFTIHKRCIECTHLYTIDEIKERNPFLKTKM